MSQDESVSFISLSHSWQKIFSYLIGSEPLVSDVIELPTEPPPVATAALRVVQKPVWNRWTQ